VQAQDSSEYNEWKKQFLTEYSSYKDEIDSEFSQFLKLRWKKFDTHEGEKRDPVPKPVSMPKDRPQSITGPDQVPVSAPPTPVVKKPLKLPKPDFTEGEKVEFDFLGHRILLSVAVDKRFFLNGPVNQQTLQKGFDELAQTEYENLIADLAAIRNKLQLNDWAYLQLVMDFSESFVPSSNNSANLLTWFLLLKSDLKSRIAFSQDEIYLLMSTKFGLYGMTYFEYSNERFYVVSRHDRISNSLFSYNGSYPKKLPKFNLSDIDKVLVGKSIEYRDISFNYGSKKYQLRIPFNQHVIDFLDKYPQMSIEHYFNVAISEETQQALLSQLRPLTEQMSKREAINFLLRLVQTGFDYKTDKQQFGKENYLFLEETIFYPSSDCEDRSVIFAWLVSELLGIEVVGLDYPGHIATAVHLDNPSGTTISSDGKVYSIADPTYINASVGGQMPQFKNIKPVIINFIR
jgi:hypothetical protein